MWISTQAFHTPKRGNLEHEYEDAYVPECEFRTDLSEFHCAVADGASESAYSGEWARLLARGYCHRGVSLSRLQRCWLRIVNRRPLPWYLEAKVRRGAHAALVGLSLRNGNADDAPGGSWVVTAVGDSCFFHVRDDGLLTVAPLSGSKQFDNTPHLISTDAAASFGLKRSRIKRVSGEWRPGDSFYLATDALAQWILMEHEGGRSPWSVLRGLDPAAERSFKGAQSQCFDEMISALREQSEVRNDDMTLLRVEVA
ncbi:MAG: hypothetical protein GTO40_13180 [Deltaproteobacteria bacterium]|nr:hypothetical protein [Deltaproteobacteria bacterium]